MTKTRQAFQKSKRGIDWRQLVGDSFLLAGTLVLFTTMLFWVRSAMAAQQNGFQPYLVSSIDSQLPLPSTTLAASPQQAQEGQETPVAPASAAPGLVQPLALPTEAAAAAPAGEIPPSATPTAASPTAGMPQATPAMLTATDLPDSSEQPALAEQTQPPQMEQTQPALPEQTLPAQTEPTQPVETEISDQPPADLMYPTPESPAAPPAVETPVAPVQAPAAGPVVRLVIPRLQVNRAVVPVELRGGGNGKPDWNTDVLFSTPNRSDLVGQLAVSANPGEGGNIILVGHNYNNGWYDWEGVFVRLGSLQAGDTISLYSANGGEFHYIVEKVKKVPWQKRNLAELEKHQKFLWPTGREQLTLVTCGGTVLWTWQARIYVVAVPLVQPSP